jgi:hypothetical protein
MARERGMADIEAGVSMRSWNWMAYKKRDAVKCPSCHTVVIPGAVSGTFDFPNVGIPIWKERGIKFIDVEVKAGKTSLAFSELRPNQREWADENPENAKWIWLCIGKGNVNAKKQPRKTWFFPYRVFLELEEILERESIPYDCPQLKRYELEWVGKKSWRLPWNHPARTIHFYV